MNNILDVCCGSKMFHFDKKSKSVIFGDIRKETHILCDHRILKVHPDIILDFRDLPFKSSLFKMVIFDPPHLVRVGKNSWMYKKYGGLDTDWREILEDGFRECFRVLDTFGTLIFKWNDDQIKVSEILKLTSYRPIIGHKSGKRSKTHWLSFLKY